MPVKVHLQDMLKKVLFDEREMGHMDGVVNPYDSKCSSDLKKSPTSK